MRLGGNACNVLAKKRMVAPAIAGECKGSRLRLIPVLRLDKQHCAHPIAKQMLWLVQQGKAPAVIAKKA